MIIIRRADMSDRDIARFWAKVDKSGDCWIWTAAADRYGYGRIWLNGKQVFAHRFAYALAHGECADDLVIDHMCHNILCVNPAHLHLVTVQQNNENEDVRKDNRSGFRGVSWCAARDKWRVEAQVRGRKYFGGYYDDVHEAGKSAIALRDRLMTNNILDRNGESTGERRKGHDRSHAPEPIPERNAQNGRMTSAPQISRESRFGRGTIVSGESG